MQLSPLYLEKIAAGEQRGRLQERREMVILFLTLNVEQFQSLATSVF
jgi:hypothetical protein